MKIDKRNLDQLKRLFDRIRGIPGSALRFDLISILMSFVVIIQLFGALIFEFPTWGDGQILDLTKFSLTWSDEFSEGTFNKTYWSGHYVWGDNATYKRDYGYWNRCMTSFRDDCLIITADYLENGPSEPEGPDGPAYFAYGMDTNPYTDGPTKPGFEQLYGYFECRCILPKGEGVHGAFWLLTDGMWADDTDGGISGCEIDILETNDPDSVFKRNSLFQTVHIDSYGDAHKQEVQGRFYSDNPFDKFNTYGLEWNPEGYIFYVNGVETARTDFGGVCEVPLYLILTVGINENVVNNEQLPSEFIVDYVRVYQYKDFLS